VDRVSAVRLDAYRLSLELPKTVLWVCVIAIFLRTKSGATALQLCGPLVPEGRYGPQTIELIWQEVKKHPRNPEDNFLLGIALFQDGRLGAAVGPLSRAAGDPKLARKAICLLAIALYNLNDLEAAIPQFEECLQFYPDCPEALYYLISACRRTGRKAEASNALGRLLRVAPQSAYTYKLMGEAYDSEEEWSKAAEALRLAIAKAPDLPELHFELGMVYWQMLNYDEAAFEFRREIKAVQRGPSCARSWYYLGDIAMKRLRYHEAAVDYSKSLRMGSAQYDVLCSLARAYEAMSRDSDALQCLRRAERLAPLQPDAHWELAHVLGRMGHQEEAARERKLFEATAQRHHITGRPKSNRQGANPGLETTNENRLPVP
jgi:tetratricopeptide (TPR) repeat protein